MLEHKSVHFWLLLAVLVGTTVLLKWHPDLFNGTVTTFSTIGVIVTLYSVMFAVIEVVRTKNVAETARQQAEIASQGVVDLYTIKDMSSCQSAIEMAMDSMDRNEAISASNLCLITRIYSQVFYEELDRPDSEHRIAKSLLDAYNFAAKDKTMNKQSSKQKLNSALLTILGHVSVKVGKSTQSREMT